MITLPHTPHVRQGLLRWILGVSYAAFFLLPIHAQDGPLEALNPAEIFFQIFNIEKKAYELRTEGKIDESIEYYRKANTWTETLKKNNPAWNPERVRKLQKRIGDESAKLFAIKERQANGLQPKLIAEEKPSKLVERAKRRAEEQLQENEKIKSISERLKEIQDKLNKKEQELHEGQAAKSATRDELLQIIASKNAQLKELAQGAQNDQESATQKQKVLSDEVAALRNELQTKDATRTKNEETQRAQLAAKELEVNTLKDQVGALQKEKKKLEDKGKAETQRVEKVESLISELQQKNQDLKAAFSNRELQYSKKIQTLAQQIAEIENTPTTTPSQTADTPQQAPQDTPAHSTAQLQAAAAKAEALAQQAIKDKEAANTSAAQAQAEKEKVEALAQQALQEKEDANKNASEIQAAKEKAEALAQQALIDKEAANKSAAQAQAEKEKVAALAQQALQEKAAANKSAAQAQAANTAAQSKLTAQQQQTQEAKEQLATLQSLHADTVVEQQQELTKIRNKAKETTQQILELDALLQQARIDLETSTTQQANKDAQLTQLNAQLDAAREQQAASASALQKAELSVQDLSAEVATLQQERELLMMRPLLSEVEALQEDLRTTSTERELLLQSLSSNESKYYEARERIALLQKELQTARLAASKLEENMSEEREISNDVIKAQRERLTKQQVELQATQRLLANEQDKATTLQQIVTQTKEEYKDIKTKYDSLTTDYAQLRLLLSNDKAGDQLKEENIRLQRDLRQARDDFQKKLSNDQTEKADLLIARKKYGVLQAELIKTKHSLEIKTLQADKLLAELERTKNDLNLMEQTNDSKYTPEEVAMLKQMIQQQMRLQENRQMVRASILEEVQRLGIDDSAFLRALDLAETQELFLTEDQQQLLKAPEADSEFRYENRATPAERQRAQEALAQRLSIHQNLGRRAYESGNYLVAEEFFQVNLDDHPGHIPSMLNLGVTQLRRAQATQDAQAYAAATLSFEDAIAMSGLDGLPYAQQMLGYSYYNQGIYQKAAEHFRQCLENDPNNAVAHVYLGVLRAEEDDLTTAESHLRKAITIDPTLHEPEYNLAELLCYQGKHQDALTHYRSALRKGASSDPALESKLQLALPKANF